MKSRIFGGRRERRGGPPRDPAVAISRADRSGPPGGPLAAGVPLGSIFPRTLVDSPHIVMTKGKDTGPLAERYRRLRFCLEVPRDEGAESPSVIVVTSAVPGDGKTTTALNLALAFAEDAGRSVLLVDGDLRRGSLASYVEPSPSLGLAEVLEGDLPLDHALIDVKGTRLTMLPSGAVREAPLELIRAPLFATVMGDLRRRYRTVVIDTPPCVPFTDAAMFNTHADGALVVVRSGATPKPLVLRAVESLAPGAILGAVLNDVQMTPVDRYYYRYDDYDPERYRERKRR